MPNTGFTASLTNSSSLQSAVNIHSTSGEVDAIVSSRRRDSTSSVTSRELSA